MGQRFRHVTAAERTKSSGGIGNFGGGGHGVDSVQWTVAIFHRTKQEEPIFLPMGWLVKGLLTPSAAEKKTWGQGKRFDHAPADLLAVPLNQSDKKREGAGDEQNRRVEEDDPGMLSQQQVFPPTVR